MGLNRLLQRAANFFIVKQSKRRKLADTVQENEPVWFDLHSSKLLFDGARHFNCLALQLVEMGHPVVVIDRQRQANRLARKTHGLALIQCPHVVFMQANQSPPAGSIVFTDAMPSDPHCCSIRVSIGTAPVAGAIVYPFPAHPSVRPTLTRSQLAHGRSRDQRARIFFSGNQKKSYANALLSTQFSACNRLALLNHLRSKFDGLCENLEHWPRQLDCVWKPIIIGDSRKVAIHPTQWLDALSHFDFFVGCPGVAHPMCHNLTEAMSVGTIPILEHSNRFTPHLVDGKNAVLFSGLRGFEDAIQRVLDMNDATIRHLRRGVIEYYDANLQADKFIRRLMLIAKLRGGAVLSIPYHHMNLDPSPVGNEAVEMEKKQLGQACAA